MYLTVLSLCIIIVGALLVLHHMQQGQKVGFVRAAIRLSTVILSAIIAAFFSDWMSGIMQSPAESLLYLVGLDDAVRTVLGNADKFIEIVADPIAATLLYIPMFLVLFGLFTLILKLVFDHNVKKDVMKRGDYSKENAPFYERESKSLGMACGILTGIVMLVAVFSPVSGALKLADEVIRLPGEIMGESIDNSDTEMLHRYSNDLMLSVVHATGGNVLFDTTSRLKGSEGRSSFRKELKYFRQMDKQDMELILGAISFGDIDGFRRMLSVSKDSVIMEAAVYCTFTGACQQWQNGVDYMGIPAPCATEGDSFRGVMRYIYNVCAYDDISNFRSNATTVLNVIDIIGDSGVGSGNYYDRIRQFLSGDVIAKINKELEKNKRMNYYGKSAEELVASVIATELYSAGYSYDSMYQLYENIATAYNNTSYLSGDSRVEQMALLVEPAFSGFGMPLPAGAAEALCMAMINELSYYSNMYYWDVENFFINKNNSYYNYY